MSGYRLRHRCFQKSNQCLFHVWTSMKVVFEVREQFRGDRLNPLGLRSS